MNPKELARRFPSEHWVNIAAIWAHYQSALVGGKGGAAPARGTDRTRSDSDRPAHPLDRQAASYHEAGHILAVHLLGGQNRGVIMNRDGTADAFWRDLPDDDARCLALAAGMAAQQFFDIAVSQAFGRGRFIQSIDGTKYDRERHREITGLPPGLEDDARWRRDVGRARALLEPHGATLQALARRCFSSAYVCAAEQQEDIEATLWT